MAPVALAAPLVLMAHRRLPQAVAVMAARASTDFGLARCLLATAATVVLAARLVTVVTVVKADTARRAATVQMV